MVTERPVPHRSKIMIVDDNPINLRLLESMLRLEEHEVQSFSLGRLALAAAVRNPPDLILLDINMPEMNGYEVCERLKSTPEVANVPIVFLSALTETENKLKAFRAGGVDYVSKPFHVEEVHARVETHLKLHHLERALQLQNEHLEETVAARTQELAEANGRLTILDRSKTDFLNLISHEFRTPLHGLLGFGELILAGMPHTKANEQFKVMFERCRRRILTILDDALLLTQIDVEGKAFNSWPVSLTAALNRALERTAEFAESRNVLLPPPQLESDFVLGDPDLLERALQVLLETAVKFCEKGKTVRLGRGMPPDPLTLIIESRGTAIPVPVLGKFFDIFSIGEPITPGGDLGLGPPVAYRILSRLGGSVSVTNLDPPGIRLTISLQHAASNGFLSSRPDSAAEDEA